MSTMYLIGLVTRHCPSCLQGHTVSCGADVLLPYPIVHTVSLGRISEYEGSDVDGLACLAC